LLFVRPEDAGVSESQLTVPDGFEPQTLDITHGSVLKPKGSFNTYFSDNKSLVRTISKEDPKGGYKTALRIQFWPDASITVKGTPPQIAETFLAGKRKSVKVLYECTPKQAGEFTRICLETLEPVTGSGETGNYHILYTVSWYTNRDIMTLITFGAPEKEWDDAKRFYDQMKYFELVGKDFWKNPQENKR